MHGLSLVIVSILAANQSPQAPGGPTVSAPPQAAPAPGEGETAELPPWTGTVEEGIEEIVRLADEGDTDSAVARGESILHPTRFLRWRAAAEEKTSGWSELLLDPIEAWIEPFGWNGPPEVSRAEVRYAMGVAAAVGGDVQVALDGFQRAGSLSGSNSLRRHAMYDQGTLLLAVAEELRLQIPEVQNASQAGGAPVPVAPPPPQTGAGGDEEAPDPLDIAEAAYRMAKGRLVDRLRFDWKDVDTRANLEWIQRRLKELDEIREQREKEQQDGEDQNQDDSEQDQDPSEDSQDPEKQDGEQESDEEREQDPGEEQEDQQDEEQEEQEESQEDEESDAESEQDAEQPEPEEAPEPEEELMTREQIMRLLEQLEEIDKEAEKLRARLVERRRVPVEKDW